jgi:hypothetical protein
MEVGESIVFSDTMFGEVISPQTVYYIESIVDANEFTISETQGGSVLVLTDEVGGAIGITNDYAFGIASNGISATIIFAAQYDDTEDYLTYTVFGETFPDQYGYTIPELQLIEGDGTVGPFTLTNYVGDDNPLNAVVEIDGVRILDTEYTIDDVTNTLTFTTLTPSSSETIAVTSYNLTERQDFNTQYDITGATVSNIVNINNEITPPIVTTYVTATTTGTNLLTCSDTSGFIVDQTIIFQGTTFGNVLTNGTVYYVKAVTFPYDGTFTISQTLGGATYALTTDTGVIIAYVGGQPAVRVTTGSPHGLASPTASDELIRIDGTLGSIQLNNNTYYVHVISDTQVDLYNTPYLSDLGDVNDPVTSISTYTSGGYMWIDETFVVDSVWEQSNVDRLWVTINGYRVPASSLYLNADNNLSILVSIISTDDITITSMIPSATPNQLVYLQNVNKNGTGSVYRANTDTRTWLVEPLYYTNETIYVSDVTRITDTLVQNEIAPAAVDGIISIGLDADKNTISQVIVYNTTTSSYVNSNNHSIVIIDLVPILQITDEVTVGDSLVITTIEGNLIYINGEQIRFTTVDLDINTISGLQRGTNGTGIIDYMPKYSEVFGILSNNLLPSVNYNLTWNSNVYNVTDGDPLQISETNAAYFLNSGVS